MSFIGNMFGAGNGSGFQANQGPQTPILNPADTTQYSSLYNQGQGNLNQQQNLVNALQAQNGIQNQSNVFAQQQQLANQLQQNANGTGPNPAQAQLAQNTAANTQNQAALMASGRGASANAGLLARNAAEVGAQNQQGAVGQAATLQAQQQLAGQNALAAQQQAMAQGAQTQVGNLQGALNSQAGATQGLLGQTGSQINAQNQANVGMAENVNSANAGQAAINTKGQQGIVGGGLSAAGSALGLANGGLVSPMYAQGGMVDCYAEGGMAPFYADGGSVASVAPPVPTVQGASQFKKLSDQTWGNSGNGGGASSSGDPMQQGVSDFGKGLSKFAQNNWGSGAAMPTDPAMSMAGGAGDAGAVGMGEAADAAGAGAGLADAAVLAAKSGGSVPGKAKVAGDSYANDTVPAILSPGEVVIPRHIMQGKNPAADAAKFVAAIMAKNGTMSKGVSNARPKA